LFLRISEGEDGRATVPIVASTDPEVIGAAVRALARRLGVIPPTLTTLRGRELVRDAEREQVDRLEPGAGPAGTEEVLT
jgi:hypothetical protein